MCVVNWLLSKKAKSVGKRPSLKKCIVPKYCDYYSN